MRPPSGCPVVGEIIHSPTFAGGSELQVVRIIPPNGKSGKGYRGWRVATLVRPMDGRRISVPVRRWSLDTWLDFSRESERYAKHLRENGEAARWAK